VVGGVVVFVVVEEERDEDVVGEKFVGERLPDRPPIR
jgi:hypothetical protein